MCGFCGFTGELIESDEILTKMMDKIVHRGPDSAGKHIDGGVAMGFRRLSIIVIRSLERSLYKKGTNLKTTPIRKFLYMAMKSMAKSF